MGHKRKSHFQLQGRFVGFSDLKHGLPKRLLVESHGHCQSVKLSKPLRAVVSSRLTPGMTLLIQGEARHGHHAGHDKLKALSIRCVSRTPDAPAPALLGSIQVCGKSNCWKNGGREVWSELKRTLTEKGLEGRVQLEMTGCLDHCKKCPNLLCLPDGSIHTRMTPEKARELIEEQFPSDGKPEPDAAASPERETEAEPAR